MLEKVGAIDNITYRQINGTNIITTSSELRGLKKENLLDGKGKGRATYYISGKILLSAPVTSENILSSNTSDNQGISALSAPPQGLSAPPQRLSAPPSPAKVVNLKEILPNDIKVLIDGLGIRNADKNKIKDIIVKLCQWRSLKSSELASLLGRSEKYILREYITPLKDSGKIKFTIPDMENHPHQAYKA